MHVKNIRNMKFNGQIFKIHTKKKRYMRSLKKLCSVLCTLEKQAKKRDLKKLYIKAKS